MCFDEGRIQAYIDGELQDREAGELQEHLSVCRECEAVYQRLIENDLMVRTSMEGFVASDRERFNAELAWSRLKLKQIEYEKKKNGKWYTNMKYKKLFTAAAAVAVVAVIGFTPVSSMAGNFLTIFRVEKVKAITITPDDMQQMEKVMREGAGGVDIRNFGKVEVRGTHETKPVTLEEARNSVDFDLKVPSIEGYSGPTLKKTSATSVTMTLDVDNVNAALQAFGSTEKLPREMNGQEFTVDVPTGISAQYSGPEGSLMFAQSRGPSVKTAQGVDVMAIRQALLSMPVLPESLKKQLMAVDDWQHTVLIPVREGQSTDVRVNGNDGVFVRDISGSEAVGALVWQNGGVISVLAGDGLTADSALAIAGTIK
ncbi:MAG: zf-HC2 domain-containing protein [Actinobacteria bacterium]|nr:zf-HC2 domain-containing protein [Actinomycetota bacterium]